MKTHVLPSLTLLFIAALLSGCGGSDTKIVEREPIPIEYEHDDHDDHSHELESGVTAGVGAGDVAIEETSGD